MHCWEMIYIVNFYSFKIHKYSFFAYIYLSRFQVVSHSQFFILQIEIEV